MGSESVGVACGVSFINQTYGAIGRQSNDPRENAAVNGLSSARQKRQWRLV